MTLLELQAIDTTGFTPAKLTAHNKKIAKAISEQSANVTTFVCKVNKPNAISFAPSIPDGIDVGATVQAVCVATQSDMEAILNPKTPIIVKKEGKFKGMEIINFLLPFTFTNKEGRKFTKNVNCNGSTVIANTEYNILKIEEMGTKDGQPKTYEKYVLQSN